MMRKTSRALSSEHNALIPRLYVHYPARHEALAIHLDLGLAAYRSGDAVALNRHKTAIALLPEGGNHCEAFGALAWRHSWLEDRYDEALASAAKTTSRFPLRAEPLLEYADLLNDLERVEQARDVLLKATDVLPEVADIWYEAGLACEQLNDRATASDCFRRVWRLEAAHDPEFVFWLTEVEFDEAVAAVLANIPDHLRGRLSEVAVVVQDYPGPWIVAGEAMNPRLLAMVESETGELGEVVTQLVLYRWNIERASHHERAVAGHIEGTIRRELAVVFDVDPEDLEPTSLA